MNSETIKNFKAIGIACVVALFLALNLVRTEKIKGQQDIAIQSLISSTNVTKLGWLTMVKRVQAEPESGAEYIIVSISNDTNNIASFRTCWINIDDGFSSKGKPFWRDNPKTGEPEVFIIEKDLAPYVGVLFVKRDAPLKNP